MLSCVAIEPACHVDRRQPSARQQPKGARDIQSLTLHDRGNLVFVKSLIIGLTYSTSTHQVCCEEKERTV
jgi:hypothetical protein